MEIEPRLNGQLRVSGTFPLRDAVGEAFDLSGNAAVFL